MRRTLVAGNWKMHGSLEMVDSLLKQLTRTLGSGVNSVDAVVCPPTPYLARAQILLRGSELILGAQNAWHQAEGAVTGEVSPQMLADFQVRYVILGHSERRQLLAEDDALIARKFAAVSACGQIPILCVGETLEQREAGAAAAEAIVAAQLDAVLAQVGVQGFAGAVIAYEPVWAIGTGRTASPEQAQQMHAAIRDRLGAQDAALADAVQIVYGGSVKPDNAERLLAQPDIDGGLIGGASLDAEAFIKICNSVS